MADGCGINLAVPAKADFPQTVRKLSARIPQLSARIPPLRARAIPYPYPYQEIFALRASISGLVRPQSLG
jgi:hypothetical protein